MLVSVVVLSSLNKARRGLQDRESVPNYPALPYKKFGSEIAIKIIRPHIHKHKSYSDIRVVATSSSNVYLEQT